MGALGLLGWGWGLGISRSARRRRRLVYCSMSERGKDFVERIPMSEGISDHSL